MPKTPQPGHRLPFMRRLSQKTDYAARLALLKSGKPRMVVRRTLNNMHVQVVVYEMEGDKTLAEVMSKHLVALGWKGHTGNLPAAYLTGFLAGCIARQKGINECIADLGLQTTTKGNALFAAIKGARDAGLSIPVSEDMLPDDGRMRGTHIARYAGGRGTGIEQNFEEVKEKIIAQYGQKAKAEARA